MSKIGWECIWAVQVTTATPVLTQSVILALAICKRIPSICLNVDPWLVCSTSTPCSVAFQPCHHADTISHCGISIFVWTPSSSYYISNSCCACLRCSGRNCISIKKGIEISSCLKLMQLLPRNTEYWHVEVCACDRT